MSIRLFILIVSARNIFAIRCSNNSCSIEPRHEHPGNSVVLRQHSRHDAFIIINSIPTRIVSWGSWIEESFTKKEVVICIPGSPGLPGFYSEFMETIHHNIDPDIPVWLVGQAGQDEPPRNSFLMVPALRGNEMKFDLDAQVKHKLEFIKSYVPNDVKIHLIGHSIGSWMIIEMLKQRMAITPNGIFFTEVVQRFWPLLRFIVIGFSKIPVDLKVTLLTTFLKLSGMPYHLLGTAMKYLRPSIMEKVVFLANEQMKRLNALDSETIATLRSNHRILKLYYGATDGWAPVKYCQQLKQKIPELDVEIDRRKFEHAFIIKSSNEVGKMVAGWIMSKRRKF